MRLIGKIGLNARPDWRGWAYCFAMIFSVLACAPSIAAIADGTAFGSRLWISEDGALTVYRGNGGQRHRLCPRFADQNPQPFCRDFSADVLGICGSGNVLLLVLADGSLHRVNRALIGVDGGFEPAYRPMLPMLLRHARLSESHCEAERTLPSIDAVAADGTAARFDGRHWTTSGTDRPKSRQKGVTTIDDSRHGSAAVNPEPRQVQGNPQSQPPLKEE